MSQLRVKQNALQKFNQWLPASPLGARMFSKFLHLIDAPLMKLTNEKISVPQLVTGLPCVRLTSVGAKSGVERTIPTIGVPDGENVALICSNWGQSRNPGWYYNLKKHPQAELAFVTTDGKSHEGAYTATEIVDDSEYERLWQKACAVYIGYPKYRVRAANRRIPIMLMQPS
ncbi:MAG: nitroreductase family deazaflavin-dependent oxidoreductase [Gammaproteobacteria bacterium]